MLSVTYVNLRYLNCILNIYYSHLSICVDANSSNNFMLFIVILNFLGLFLLPQIHNSLTTCINISLVTKNSFIMGKDSRYVINMKLFNTCLMISNCQCVHRSSTFIRIFICAVHWLLTDIDDFSNGKRSCANFRK